MNQATDIRTTSLDLSALDAALDEVLVDLAPEGSTFDILGADHARARIDLRLRIVDAECVDCLMPGSYLSELVAGAMARRVDRQYSVILDDPRETHGHAGGVRPSTVSILDPTGSVKPGNPDPGPDAGRLAGRTVLFRVDALWRAWDWTVEEWTRSIHSAGGTVLTWRRYQGLPGEQGRSAQAEYAALVETADIVLSGLGNCGSCTAWTVKDALTALNAGKPTTAVVTEQFAPLAALLAADGSRPGLRLFQLPYPLDTRPEEEVRQIARLAFAGLLTAIGAES